ncbi:MAG: hisD [Gammaproteobacteria bacterium]|jgi:histidinol dehydrogenase|nr:hisD [Gammaproteobacteria bacterium]
MKTVTWQTLDERTQRALLRPTSSDKERNNLLTQVSEIIENVKVNGDAAIKAYTQRFDHIMLQNLRVTEEALDEAENIPDKHKRAIQTARDNIQRFHQPQYPSEITLENNGITTSKIYRPIESVGLYVPGGSAPLISTVLMLAIPAKIAGCPKITLVSPPDKHGKLSPYILYAAKICGVTDIYTVGGAQAIAALAYGTASIPKADKIFGPGNKYVTAAKVQVSYDPQGAALDMPAGPSEVLVIADANANPEFIASDLLAQAEHDPDARSLLVTPSESLSKQVKQAVERQKNALSRKEIIDKSIGHALIIIAPNLETCFKISNQHAPEHLILHLENPRQYQNIIQNAGSVFMGAFTPESLGDYASGPNHVLPTEGYARNTSGLGVLDFMKAISFQEATKEGLETIAETVETLALLEGLDAHQQAVAVRRSV